MEGFPNGRRVVDSSLGEGTLHGGLVPSLRARRFSPAGLETAEMKQVSETRTRLCKPLESRKRRDHSWSHVETAACLEGIKDRLQC